MVELTLRVPWKSADGPVLSGEVVHASDYIHLATHYVRTLKPLGFRLESDTVLVLDGDPIEKRFEQEASAAAVSLLHRAMAYIRFSNSTGLGVEENVHFLPTFEFPTREIAVGAGFANLQYWAGGNGRLVTTEHRGQDIDQMGIVMASYERWEWPYIVFPTGINLSKRSDLAMILCYARTPSITYEYALNWLSNKGNLMYQSELRSDMVT